MQVFAWLGNLPMPEFNILFSCKGAENAEVICTFLQSKFRFILHSLRSLRLCESKYL